MNIVNCKHCDKEINLNTESYDRNAIIRYLNTICSKFKDGLQVEAEETTNMRKLKDGYVYQIEEKIEDVINKLDVMRESFQQCRELQEIYIDISTIIQQGHYNEYPEDLEFVYRNEEFEKILEKFEDTYDTALEEAFLSLKKLEPRDHMEVLK